MSPPAVRVNTFVKKYEATYIDPISKAFIIFEVLFGYNRIPLTGKKNIVYPILTLALFLIINCSILYASLFLPEGFMDIIVCMQMLEYIGCGLLSFICCKRMQCYYNQLNKFDEQVCYRPKVSNQCIRNVVQAIVICFIFVLLLEVPMQLDLVMFSSEELLVYPIAYSIELHYFGHLLELLTPRLKLINFYVQSSFSNGNKFESSQLQNRFISLKCNEPKVATQYHMGKLMDLYQTMVDAYDFLVEAIKWQLFLVLIATFVSILSLLYNFSLHAVRGGQNIVDSVIQQLGMSVTLMLPLFSPCTSCDKVNNEVRKLRELLASRLYESKLDKSGRSVARALLAYTETRDLSFKLLRMLNIDISMPFKFVGLIVTYLIILLQFEKVINP